MRKIITRKGKLENRIRVEISRPKPELGKILDAVDEFEKANLATIDKLKKKKQFEAKRINGALKQTINAHGPINKLLIGSATKRILGSLITDEYEKAERRFSIKSILLGLGIGIVLSLLFNLFI